MGPASQNWVPATPLPIARLASADTIGWPRVDSSRHLWKVRLEAPAHARGFIFSSRNWLPGHFSVIAPSVAPTDHSAGMTDGGSGHADTSYSGPEWAASEADLRDHAVRGCSH